MLMRNETATIYITLFDVQFRACPIVMTSGFDVVNENVTRYLDFLNGSMKSPGCCFFCRNGK